MKRLVELSFPLAVSFCIVLGCSSEPTGDGATGDGAMDDGPVAAGLTGALGEVMPSATVSQVEAFERGRVVMTRRFDLSDGLGPSFNVASCGACHEKPTIGGSAGLYRNFFLAGRLTSDGAFLFSESDGDAGGVLRMFRYALDGLFRPAVPESTAIFAQRNSIPIFGAGLIAALSDEEILSRADEDDSDGDGISGRANFDRGFVGRFGRKAQVVSIEAFIRGPLFNHLGITTEPLTDAQRTQLPVDSALAARIRKFHRAQSSALSTQHSAVAVRGPHQVAAPEEGTTDSDGVADPEMNGQDLFDLISFVMLLAAPQLEEPTAQSNRGRLLFHQANCSACHTPRLEGPSGPIAVYSDLLLHEMGAGLADGIVMGLAGGSEFRTQPLWGIAATGPYLHDGRVSTIVDGILAHGGEAQASRDAFAAMSGSEQDDVVEFLMSLGGRAQASDGLLEPDAPIPGVGEYGGPFRQLTTSEQEQFLRGRAVYDQDFGFADGAGALAGSDGVGRFNGDSCRACHSDPVIGGAGPRDVNVMRHGIVNDAGVFSAPPTTPNTILHKQIVIGHSIVQPTDDINVFEHRQAPHNFGLGLIDAISEETILSNADPDDTDGDGISGRAHILLPNDGRIGRLGWKADVPSVAEFVRDAMAAEIGLTIPQQADLTFGLTTDDDGIADPELSVEDAEDLAFFLSMLAGPPRQPTDDQPVIEEGEALFASVGCAKCHIPSLPSSEGDVALYSDLLLHEILPAGTRGIESGDASQREFRTAPLWGLSQTAPYFHSGEADTIDQAIRLHDGEAAAIVQAYLDLGASDQQALLAFLDSL